MASLLSDINQGWHSLEGWACMSKETSPDPEDMNHLESNTGTLLWWARFSSSRLLHGISAESSRARQCPSVGVRGESPAALPRGGWRASPCPSPRSYRVPCAAGTELRCRQLSLPGFLRYLQRMGLWSCWHFSWFYNKKLPLSTLSTGG